MRVNAARLQAEVAALPEGSWAGTGGRVGVHRAAQAIFLRGFAPAEGEKPIEDREPLGALPYVRELIIEADPGSGATLPAGAPAAGRAGSPRTSTSRRISRRPSASMCRWSPMTRPGCTAPGSPTACSRAKSWALNNSAPHGVWNAHATQARTHLICDFLPSPELLGLLARAERDSALRMPSSIRVMRGAQ